MSARRWFVGLCVLAFAIRVSISFPITKLKNLKPRPKSANISWALAETAQGSTHKAVSAANSSSETGWKKGQISWGGVGPIQTWEFCGEFTIPFVAESELTISIWGGMTLDGSTGFQKADFDGGLKATVSWGLKTRWFSVHIAVFMMAQLSLMVNMGKPYYSKDEMLLDMAHLLVDTLMNKNTKPSEPRNSQSQCYAKGLKWVYKEGYESPYSLSPPGFGMPSDSAAHCMSDCFKVQGCFHWNFFPPKTNFKMGVCEQLDGAAIPISAKEGEEVTSGPKYCGMCDTPATMEHLAKAQGVDVMEEKYKCQTKNCGCNMKKSDCKALKDSGSQVPCSSKAVPFDRVYLQKASALSIRVGIDPRYCIEEDDGVYKVRKCSWSIASQQFSMTKDNQLKNSATKKCIQLDDVAWRGKPRYQYGNRIQTAINTNAVVNGEIKSAECSKTEAAQKWHYKDGILVSMDPSNKGRCITLTGAKRPRYGYGNFNLTQKWEQYDLSLGFVKGECPAKYTMIKKGFECDSDDKFLGDAQSAQDCADMCKKQPGCQFFKYLHDYWKWCYWEKTNSATCPEGFDDANYNFYTISDQECNEQYNFAKCSGVPGSELSLVFPQGHSMQAALETVAIREAVVSYIETEVGENSGDELVEKHAALQLFLKHAPRPHAPSLLQMSASEVTQYKQAHAMFLHESKGGLGQSLLNQGLMDLARLFILKFKSTLSKKKKTFNEVEMAMVHAFNEVASYNPTKLCTAPSISLVELQSTMNIDGLPTADQMATLRKSGWGHEGAKMVMCVVFHSKVLHRPQLIYDNSPDAALVGQVRTLFNLFPEFAFSGKDKWYHSESGKMTIDPASAKYSGYHCGDYAVNFDYNEQAYLPTISCAIDQSILDSLKFTKLGFGWVHVAQDHVFLTGGDKGLFCGVVHADHNSGGGTTQGTLQCKLQYPESTFTIAEEEEEESGNVYTIKSDDTNKFCCGVKEEGLDANGYTHFLGKIKCDQDVAGDSCKFIIKPTATTVGNDLAALEATMNKLQILDPNASSEDDEASHNERSSSATIGFASQDMLNAHSCAKTFIKIVMADVDQLDNFNAILKQKTPPVTSTTPFISKVVVDISIGIQAGIEWGEEPSSHPSLCNPSGLGLSVAFGYQWIMNYRDRGADGVLPPPDWTTSQSITVGIIYSGEHYDFDITLVMDNHNRTFGLDTVHLTFGSEKLGDWLKKKLEKKKLGVGFFKSGMNFVGAEIDEWTNPAKANTSMTTLQYLKMQGFALLSIFFELLKKSVGPQAKEWLESVLKDPAELEEVKVTHPSIKEAIKKMKEEEEEEGIEKSTGASFSLELEHIGLTFTDHDLDKGDQYPINFLVNLEESWSYQFENKITHKKFGYISVSDTTGIKASWTGGAPSPSPFTSWK